MWDGEGRSIAEQTLERVIEREFERVAPVLFQQPSTFKDFMEA